MTPYEFDVDFQNMIAAVILRNHPIISTAKSVIYPEYFTEPVLRKIVTGAIGFHKEYHSAPSLAEFIEFVGLDELGRDRIRKLFKLKIKNIDYVVGRMIEFAQYNAMREAILESSDLVDNYDNRIQIRRLISNALKVGVDSRELGMDLLRGRHGRLLHRLKHGINVEKVSTGIRKLDRMMEGGLDRGELGMIMAPPKGFKTGVLVNLATAALFQRLKVIIFTLEISENKYTMRVERRLAGLKKFEIATHDKELDKALRRIEVIKGGMIIKGYPMRSVTVEHLNNHLDLLNAEGFQADIMFVDYWDLIKASDRAGEYRHQLTSIGTELRAMAQERNIPIWTASQANRKATDKKIIRKEDIAESFEKMAIVDAAVAVCQTPEEKALDPARARLFVAANREGEEGGLAYITIDYDRMRIRELEEDEEDE